MGNMPLGHNSTHIVHLPFFNPHTSCSHPAGLGPLLSCPAYTATKHGVIGFTRAMAVRRGLFSWSPGTMRRTPAQTLRSCINTLHDAFCHQAASSVSGYGIRVNAFCPSFVQTDLFSTIASKLGQFSHLVDATQIIVDGMGVLRWAKFHCWPRVKLWADAFIPELFFFSVSDAVAPFLELVTDETKNGDALTVFPNGKKYVIFPSFL